MIGLLIDCIDKIVFSDNQETVSLLQRGDKKQDKKKEVDEQTSLAIDVSETKKCKAKQRLKHTGDFAYLLDALIYHLGIREDKAIEELDGHGRTEEEGIGTDDEENESTIFQANEQKKLLDLCHSKVRIVINRFIKQMKTYSEGKQTLDKVLVRLLAVLAVLRELRCCDGRVAWVEKGKTTVPREQRLRLFEEVMFTLFEGKTSLMHLESLGESFEYSDDVARLKGLLIWLAWDCGLRIDLYKPFMESPEQLKVRLRINAMILALVQAIRADDVVIDEARQSIGSLSSSEMDWLKQIQNVASQCDSLRHSDAELEPAEEAQPGDIAVHKNINDWDLRVVENSGGGQITLIKLDKKKDHIIYTQQHLAIARLSLVSSGV